MPKRSNGRQTAGLLFILLTGWSLTLHTTTHSWLALAIAGAGSLLLIPLYCLPAERLPGFRWFDIPQTVFGRGGGTVYLLSLSALAFWSLCMTVLGGVQFLYTVSGGAWAIWLLTAAIFLCAGMTVQKGIAQLLVWAQPIVWLVVAVLLVSLILGIRQMDFDELLLSLKNTTGLRTQTYLLLSVPFGEIFYAAACVFSQPEHNQTRTGLLGGCVAAAVVLSLLAARDVCVLGSSGITAVAYPSYTAAGLLEIGKSFQRGEVLISGSLLLCTIARAALLLDFLSGCVQTTVKPVSRNAVLWVSTVLAGVICVFSIGNTRVYEQAFQLYQLFLFPLVFLAAVLLLLGVLIWKE